MNEIKSKHFDVDAAFKSIVNATTPFREELESKDNSMSESQILETVRIDNQRSRSR